MSQGSAKGGLTNEQLRASVLPVSMSSIPLASGAATASRQDACNTFLNEISANTLATASGIGADGPVAPTVGSGVRGWLATLQNTLTSLLNALNPYRGTSTPFAGTSGSVSVPAGARIVSISAHAPTGGGTIAMFGVNVPVPANNGFSDGWSGLVGASGGSTITFTGTDSYYVVLNQ